VDDILFKDDIRLWGSCCDVTLTVDTGEATLDCKVGLVTEHLKDLRFDNVKSAAAIVVGPPPMMKFTCLGLLDIGFAEENIWVSQERRMCCGIGKCGHCKINDVYVCLDGPVFNYTKSKLLLD
ncbi:MAG: anaerobic sulfite reductase subunit AsrB, partial [Clostridiales bacterium]|jgi:anaerobic sulfite reductase subunit B|nr:anaerobic sulfite reductase subunit AsrB [Clostridiales bacterium]